MRSLILSSIFMLVGNFTFAQTDTIPSTESQLLKAHLNSSGFSLAPGLSYELALGSSTTMVVNPYLPLNYSSSEGISIPLMIRTDFRKYYNLLSRYHKGKRTTGNSANYVGFSLIGPVCEITKPVTLDQHFYGVGPIWGLQRTYGSKFNIEFSGGPYYVMSFDEGSFDSARIDLGLSIDLGWVISSRSFMQ